MPQEYTRADVRRMLALSEARLKSWEKQELIAPATEYSFSDLIAIKALQKLSANKIASKDIARAVRSLRIRLSHVEQPLNELKIVSDGRRIAVLVAGQKMEAISGQLLFDFDSADIPTMRTMPVRKPEPPAPRLADSEYWFQRGLELEEAGAPVEEAIEAYEKAVEAHAEAAGALVNLGTIYFRLKEYARAEAYYQRALETDPKYTLALFNLANLHDEQGRGDEARSLYEQSIRINPQYADAYFNLALLCERMGDSMKAVAHWKAYLKLDQSSQWARTARRQLERLKQLHNW